MHLEVLSKCHALVFAQDNMLEHVGTISTNLGVVVRLKSCIFRFEDGIGGQFSHLAGNDAWPTIIVVMFVMFVKH